MTPVAPNETCNIEFQVTNQAENGTTISEVSQEYSITVKTTGNLPLKYTLIPKENTAGKGDFVTVSTGTPQSVSDSASTVYQWTGGKFPHTDACTHGYELEISWPSDNGGEMQLTQMRLTGLHLQLMQIRQLSSQQQGNSR